MVDAATLSAVFSTSGVEQSVAQVRSYIDALDAANATAQPLGQQLDQVAQAAGRSGEQHSAARPKVDEHREALRGLGDKANELSSEQLPGLGRALSLVNEALSTVSKASESETATLGILGAGLTGVGIAAAGISFKSFESGVETLHLTSLETGLTTTAVAGLSAQMEAAGLASGSADRALFHVNTSLQTMQQSLDQGKAPTSAFAQTLLDLGVSAEGSDGKVRSLGELLPEIADKFKAQKDAADASGQAFNAGGVAAQLFGARLGPQMIPLLLQGSQGMADWNDKARQLGLGSEEQVQHLEAFKKSSAELHLELSALGAAIGSDVAPVFTAAAHGAAQAFDAFNQLPGPVRDLVVTAPLVAGGLLLGASAAIKLAEGAASTITTLTGLVGANTALAASEQAATAGMVEFDAATGASVAAAEAATVAETELAAAEGAASVGMVAALGPIGLVTAAIGLGVVAYQHFKTAADDATAANKHFGDGLDLSGSQIDKQTAAMKAQGATQEQTTQFLRNGLQAAEAQRDAAAKGSAEYINAATEVDRWNLAITRNNSALADSAKVQADIASTTARGTAAVIETTGAYNSFTDVLAAQVEAAHTAAGAATQQQQSHDALAASAHSMAEAMGLASAGVGSYQSALSSLQSIVAAASKSAQDGATFQADYAKALDFTKLSAAAQEAELARLDFEIKNGSESEKAAATSQRDLDLAVSTLGPHAADLAVHAQSLADAWAKVDANGGNVPGQLDQIKSAAAGTTEEVQKLQGEILNLFSKPTTEELAVKAQIADLTVTMDAFNVKLADSSPALQHVAAMQKVYDQALLTGASSKQQADAKANLDRALADTGAAGADIAAGQRQQDQNERVKGSLDAHLSSLQATRGALDAHTQAAINNAVPIGQLAQVHLPAVTGATNDATKATQGFTSTTQTSGPQILSALDPVTGKWAEIARAINNATNQVPGFASALGGVGAALQNAIAGGGGGGAAGGASGVSPVAFSGSGWDVPGLGTINPSHPGILAAGATSPMGTINALIAKANELGIPPRVLLAMVMGESGFDPTAVGDNGNSIGAVQINLPAHPNFTQASAQNTPAAIATMQQSWLAGWQQFGGEFGQGNDPTAMKDFWARANGAVRYGAVSVDNIDTATLLARADAIIAALSGKPPLASGSGLPGTFAALDGGPGGGGGTTTGGALPPGWVSPAQAAANLATAPGAVGVPANVAAAAAGFGQLPSPAPDTSTTNVQGELDAAQKGLVALQQQAATVDNTLKDNLNSVTQADVDAARQQRDTARQTADDKIRIAEEANQKLQDLITSGAPQAEIDAQKEIARTTADTASNAVSEYGKANTALTDMSRAALQNYTENQRAMQQLDTDTYNGRVALYADARKEEEIQGLGQVETHKEASAQTVAADRSALSQYQSLAATAFQNVTDLQRQSTEAHKQLDTDQANHADASLLAIDQANVNSIDAQLQHWTAYFDSLGTMSHEAATKMAGDVTALAQQNAATLNYALSQQNEQFAIQRQVAAYNRTANDPTATPQARAQAGAAAAAYPGLETESQNLQYFITSFQKWLNDNPMADPAVIAAVHQQILVANNHLNQVNGQLQDLNLTTTALPVNLEGQLATDFNKVVGALGLKAAEDAQRAGTLPQVAAGIGAGGAAAGLQGAGMTAAQSEDWLNHVLGIYALQQEATAYLIQMTKLQADEAAKQLASWQAFLTQLPAGAGMGLSASTIQAQFLAFQRGPAAGPQPLMPGMSIGAAPGTSGGLPEGTGSGSVLLRPLLPGTGISGGATPGERALSDAAGAINGATQGLNDAASALLNHPTIVKLNDAVLAAAMNNHNDLELRLNVPLV